MLLSHLNLRKTLQSLDRSKTITLICNKNLHSICSLFVFTQILKKEIFKYQVEFTSLDSTVNFQFDAAGETYCLSNSYSDVNNCTCGRYETVGISILYTVVKAMNLLKIETLWPVIVCFVYYKVFMNEGFYINMPLVDHCDENKKEEGNKENTTNHQKDKPTCRRLEDAVSVCEVCRETLRELVLSVKLINCKSDGIFFIKRSRLEFLNGSTVMECIKSDLRFIHEKKIFNTRGTTADRKIGEFLARRGMSISAANESYLTLDLQMKSLCHASFGECDKFVFRQGHDIEITAVEHAFIIQFYMYKQRDTYAYMCLSKRKLIDIEKVSKFYQKTVILFKDATHCASKTEDACLFTLRCGDLTDDQVAVLGPIMDRMFKIYLGYREERCIKVFQSYATGKSHGVLYTEDVDFRNIELENTVRKISQNMVGVGIKSVAEFVRSLEHCKKILL